MATARLWRNVAIAMQSALAAAKTLTAITKASPGVVSSTSHGYSNGDYVLLTVSGMWQVSHRVFRVSAVATDVFTLEGEDTTNYDTFVSGTAEKITFGTSVTSVTNLTASGGDFNFVRTTTIHDNAETQIPGTTAPTTYTMENIWDTTDAGQIAMIAAYKAQALRAFKFTIGTGGPIMVFTGYCGANGMPVGEGQGLMTAPAVITLYGAATHYSS